MKRLLIILSLVVVMVPAISFAKPGLTYLSEYDTVESDPKVYDLISKAFEVEDDLAFDEAVELYTEAIKINPAPRLFVYRSNAYQELEKLDKALEDANAGVSLLKEQKEHPRLLVMAYHQKASVLNNMKKDSEVAAAATAGLALNAGDRNHTTLLKQLLAVAHYNSGIYPMALSELSDAIKINPENGMSYCLRALVKRTLKDGSYAIDREKCETTTPIVKEWMKDAVIRAESVPPKRLIFG